MLFEKRYQPSLSVLPQQIYSYVYQRRRIGTTLASLYRVFEGLYPQEYVKTAFKKFLDEGALKEVRPGIYFVSEKLEKKIDWGKIHSNIAEISFGEYDVIDIASGTRVGRIFYPREKFVLGGRCWQLAEIVEREKKVYARYTENAPAVVKLFEGKGAGNYNYLLASVLKSRIFPEMAPNEFPVSSDGTNTFILHLFGSLYGFLICDALCEEGIDAVDVEGKILVLNRFQLTSDAMPRASVKTIKKIISHNIARLEDALGSGAYFYDLPKDYQVEDHCFALDIEGFLAFYGSIRLITRDLEDFQKAVKPLTSAF
jgi:hypothetical protein